MLDPQLTSSAAPSAARERASAAALVAEHESALVLLTTLRAASGDALRVLHFAGTLGRAAVFKRLRALVEHGVLARQSLPEARSIYRLAYGALAMSSRVRERVTDATRKQIADDVAEHCWLRSALWAELTKRGYTVGRGRDELLALRRFLIDAQAKRASGGGASAQHVLAALRAEATLTPVFRSRCTVCGWIGAVGAIVAACARCRARAEQALAERRFECAACGHVSDRIEAHESRRRAGRRCTGAHKETDHLTFDVAWRTSAGVREVLLVFVDDPSRDLLDQLRALPLRIAGQPRLPIVLRTTDTASVFDRAKRRFTSTGERHRALLRAFSEDGDKRAFPFATTAEVVDIAPELQLRLSHDRRKRNDT